MSDVFKDLLNQMETTKEKRMSYDEAIKHSVRLLTQALNTFMGKSEDILEGNVRVTKYECGKSSIPCDSDSQNEAIVLLQNKKKLLALVKMDGKYMLDVDPEHELKVSGIYSFENDDTKNSAIEVFNNLYEMSSSKTYNEQEVEDTPFVKFMKGFREESDNENMKTIISLFIGVPADKKFEGELAEFIRDILKDPNSYTYVWTNSMMTIESKEDSSKKCSISIDPDNRVTAVIGEFGKNNPCKVLSGAAKDTTKTLVSKIKETQSNSMDSYVSNLLSSKSLNAIPHKVKDELMNDIVNSIFS